MLRLMMRGAGLLILIFLLVPAGFSKSPARKASRGLSNVDEAVSASSADSTASSDAAKSDETGAWPQCFRGCVGCSPRKMRSAPRKVRTTSTSPRRDSHRCWPRQGRIGLFTLETGDTLPKGGFAFSAFGNKFGRMPGSVTLFQMGIDATYGITDNLNVYATFDPYGHVHVGCPGQLSLAIEFACQPLAPLFRFPDSFVPRAALPAMWRIIHLPRTIPVASET